MPVIRRRVSIAANSTNENVIAGSQYEFAKGNQIVSIGMTTTAAGLTALINSGGDVVAESFPVAISAASPVIPDDFYFTDVMQFGDRLSIPCTNSTGGALVLDLVVQIQDI